MFYFVNGHHAQFAAGMDLSDNVGHKRVRLDTMNRPHVARLSWDAWNREHIAKHEVVPEEAEEVVAGTPFFRETYKQRLQLIGPTATGRMLSIVVGADPDQPSEFYVFSARPASRKERGMYERARGRST
ncbi:MAG: BrnT family toxin [Chloroflexia bacterium]|nr:BrnT family toxin [Chloroflexia bacterium]